MPLWDGELYSLRAAIYNLLLQIHTDKEDWKGALKLLDQAVKDMSGTTYQPWVKIIGTTRGFWNVFDKHIGWIPDVFLCARAMVKQRILLKARLGENISLNMQKLQNEGEQCCSFMWHQMALSVSDMNQQLACYQKSITSLAVLPLLFIQCDAQKDLHTQHRVTSCWSVAEWKNSGREDRCFPSWVWDSALKKKSFYPAGLYCHHVEAACHYISLLNKASKSRIQGFQSWPPWMWCPFLSLKWAASEK